MTSLAATLCLALATLAGGAGRPFSAERLQLLETWGDPSFRHAGTVTRILPLEDGRLLSAARDGTARLWDSATGRELRRFPHDRGWDVRDVAMLPDRRRILTAANDGEVVMWDLESGTSPLKFVHDGFVMGLAVARDGKSFYACDARKLVVRWNLGSGFKERRFEAHSGWVRRVALSPDGRRLYSGGDDKQLIAWDTAAASVIRSNSMPAEIFALSLDPAGARLAVGCADRSIRVLGAEDGRELWVSTLPGLPTAAAWSPDGHTLAAPHSDGLELFDSATGSLRRVTLPAAERWAAAWSADARTLYVGENNAVARYDPATGARLWPDPDAPDTTMRLRDPVFLRQAGTLVWGQEGGRDIHRYDPDRQAFARWDGASDGEGAVLGLAATPDGGRLVAALGGGRLAGLYTANGQRLFTRNTAGGWDTRAIAFAPDGRLFVATDVIRTLVFGDDNRVREEAFYQPDDFRLRNDEPSVLAPLERCWRMAVGGGGRRLLAGYRENLLVFDVTTRRLLEAIPLPERETVTDFGVLESDGRSILMSTDKRISLWPRRPPVFAGPIRTNEVLQLAARLASKSFAEREAATRQLAEMGEEALAIAAVVPQEDPEVRLRIRDIRESLESQRNRLYVMTEQPCVAVWCVPGGPNWIAAVGGTVKTEVWAGEFRDGKLRVLRRMVDDHAPCDIVAGPRPGTFLTVNRDGTFSLYGW